MTEFFFNQIYVLFLEIYSHFMIYNHLPAVDLPNSIFICHQPDPSI